MNYIIESEYHSRYSEYCVGWTAGTVVQFLAWARFSFCPKCLDQLWFHPGSHSVDTKCSFSGVWQLGCEADYPLLSSAKFKNVWNCTFTV